MNFIHPDDVSILADLNKDLFSGSAPDHTQVREFRAYDGEGNIVWLEGRPTVVYDETGKLDFVVSAYRDITVRKQREAELVEARQEAEEALPWLHLAAKANHQGSRTHLAHLIRAYQNQSLIATGCGCTSTQNDGY